MNYYKLEPEVTGGFGPNTELDSSVFPPRVKALHYEIEGWLGDCLVESFPCYLITEKVYDNFTSEGITGFSIQEAMISTSDEFKELFPNKILPDFKWLVVNGQVPQDDLTIDNDNCLVVSERALTILRDEGIKNCDIEEVEAD